MEELYKQKAIIENAAVARSEAEMRAEQRSKVVDKKEAAKRSETPTAAEAAPEGQIQEEQELSQSDETTAQVTEDQIAPEEDLTQFPLFEVTDPKLKSDFGKKFRKAFDGGYKGNVRIRRRRNKNI